MRDHTHCGDKPAGTLAEPSQAGDLLTRNSQGFQRQTAVDVQVFVLFVSDLKTCIQSNAALIIPMLRPWPSQQPIMLQETHAQKTFVGGLPFRDEVDLVDELQCIVGMAMRVVLLADAR